MYVFAAAAASTATTTTTTTSSTTLGGPWPPQANVTSILYPGYPPANYNPVSLCLPPRSQSILISVDHILSYLQGLSTLCF